MLKQQFRAFALPSLSAWGCSFFGTVPKSGKANGSPYSLIFSFSSSVSYGASSIKWRIAVLASTIMVGSFMASLSEFVELGCCVVENICVQIWLYNAAMCREQPLIIRVEAVDWKI
jgi:hypothetical protein